MMGKRSDSTVVSSFSALDLPEPDRSRYLALLGMTEDEFRANMLGHKNAIAEKDALAEETGDKSNMHYDDGLPAIQIDGKGEKILSCTPDPD